MRDMELGGTRPGLRKGDVTSELSLEINARTSTPPLNVSKSAKDVAPGPVGRLILATVHTEFAYGMFRTVYLGPA